jgi:hypothetical protein
VASDFAAQVEAWVKESEVLLTGVFHESAQRVTDAMTLPRGQGGNLPVDTGYLWHSIQASKTAPPPINPASKGSPDQKYALDSGPINLVINDTELGETVYICATASYAAHVNYGANGRPPALFVEQAAQQWPQIVAQVQVELKGRLAGA